jgi:hypothetical protein
MVRILFNWLYLAAVRVRMDREAMEETTALGWPSDVGLNRMVLWEKSLHTLPTLNMILLRRSGQ